MFFHCWKSLYRFKGFGILYPLLSNSAKSTIEKANTQAGRPIEKKELKLVPETPTRCRTLPNMFCLHFQPAKFNITCHGPKYKDLSN